MALPKKIVIAGLEIDIELDQDLMKRERLVGCAKYELQKICIDPNIVGNDVFNQTLIHEIIHFILYVMGNNKLRTNEEFVDGFAHLAYQVLKQVGVFNEKIR